MKAFFEAIQAFFENVAFAPYNYLRALEPESWFGANTISWIFIAIGFCAFIYWMKQLSNFNKSGEEDTSQTAHVYLGDADKYK